MNRFRLPIVALLGVKYFSCSRGYSPSFSFATFREKNRLECLNWNLMARDLLSHIDDSVHTKKRAISQLKGKRIIKVLLE